MESATSPRPNAVRMFDVTPPGAAAMIMTPSASSGGIGQTLTSRKATSGSRIICDAAPMRNSRGRVATRAKSSKVRPEPQRKHDESQRDRQNDVGYDSHDCS